MQLANITIKDILSTPGDFSSMEESLPESSRLGSRQNTSPAGRIVRQPGRVQIPNTPFLVPEQTFEIKQTGNKLKLQNLPKGDWPILTVEIDKSPSTQNLSINISLPLGNDTVAAKVLFSRYLFFLYKSQQIAIAFPQQQFAFPVAILRDDIVQAAKIAHKMDYLERVLAKKLPLPKKIANDDLLTIEFLFRGATQGNFVVPCSIVSVLWLPSLAALDHPPFTMPGEFQTSSEKSLKLFQRSVNVGIITTLLKQAKLLNPEVVEQIRQNPTTPVELHFELLDKQLSCAFGKFTQELAQDENSLALKFAQYQKELAQKYYEPTELIELTEASLILNDSTCP